MGLSTAFLTGFVSAANRSMYEKRMAAHEESVEARADFQWRQRRDEEDAREDEQLKDRNALEAQRIIDKQTYEERLHNRLQADEIVADNTAANLRAEQKAKIIATVHPEMTPEQLSMWGRESDTAIDALMERARVGETWSAEFQLFITREQAALNSANTMIDYGRPIGSSGIPMLGGVYVTTPYGSKLREYRLAGKDETDLNEDGYTANIIEDANGVPIGAELIYTDPDIYVPTPYEYDNLADASNRILSTLNDMTPSTIFDVNGDILQGDMARAFHNLEQLASDLYIKEKGRMRENKVIDIIFTKKRLELLAELTDTRMELPNSFLALASDPTSIESMTLSIQAIDDVDELLDIYNNLFNRKELYRQEILPANEVAIDAVLLAISNNPALMEFREAQKVEAAEARVPQLEDIPYNQLPEDIQGIITTPGETTTRQTGRGLYERTSPSTYELDDVGRNMMVEAVAAQQAAPLTTGRNPRQQSLLKFVLKQFNLDNTIFGRGVAQQLIESYRN